MSSKRRVVLSVEQALSMSYATLRFAHLGWRVIRLEATPVPSRRTKGDPNRYVGRPIAGEDRHSYYVAPNVGKEAIALDLKRPEGRALLHRLVRELPVDVFCTNTLPARHESLGFDYATLSGVRPDLIWCAISAMGLAHPKVPGYDPMVQALTGLVDMGLSEMAGVAATSGDARSFYRLGTLVAGLGQSHKARQYLLAAVDKDASWADPHVALAQLALDRLPTTPEAERADVLQEVAKELQAAEELDAGAPGLAQVKAQQAVYDERPDDALAELEAEVRGHPERARSWLALAELRAARGEDEEAVETLREALAAGVAGPEVPSRLAARLVQVSEPDEARRVLERALAESPSAPDLRPQLAMVHTMKDDSDAVRQVLAEQVARFPHDLASRLVLAQIEIAAGHFDQASRHLDTVLEERPDVAEAAALALVVAHRSGGDVVAARNRAVRTIGRRAIVAQFLLENGLLAEGEAILREARDKEPDDLLGPVLLATLLTLDGRAAEAEKIRADALARAPEDQREDLTRQFEVLAEQVGKVLEGKLPDDLELDVE